MNIVEMIKSIKPLDEVAVNKAAERQKNLFKPLGSLGSLEEISIKLAGISGQVKNNIDKKILFLFGADNGVYEEGISGSPKELTRTLMSKYARGQRCAINVICDNYGVDLKLVDMGIEGKPIKGDCDCVKIMNKGTANFLKEPSLGQNNAIRAMSIGAEYAEYAHKKGYSIIGNGEVGMGNTTTATACILACCGISDPREYTGRGGGISDSSFKRKQDVIEEALKKYDFDKKDPLTILSCVGGLDIAAMTGLYIGAAYYRVPIVLDGLISSSAALLAYRFSPHTKDFMIASHVSEEPAYNLAIKEVGLEPMLNLKMRLGEGSGCPFAFAIIKGAAAIMNHMATFSEMEVDDEYRKDIKMK